MATVGANSTQTGVPTSAANDPNSRYVMGGATEQLNPGFLDWWEERIFPRALDDIPFTISQKYNQRPDLLAFDTYGKDRLMWLILQYNTILNINTEFVTGAQILLPSPDRVLSLR
jgi:hypothetical protein